MEVIYGGRQTGKTTKLIEMCAEAEQRGEVSYIVCPYHADAYRIAERAKSLNLNIAFPITINEFLKGGYHGRHIEHFYIDRTEALLRHLSSVPIEAIVLDKTNEF